MSSKPERQLHDALTARGRGDFETEPRDVVGRPDVVYRGSRMSSPLAVFVDGCFWHGCPEHFKMPLKNRPFWREKTVRNAVYDRGVSWRCVACDEQSGVLPEMGWVVLRFWEHDIQRRVEWCASRIIKELKRLES